MIKETQEVNIWRVYKWSSIVVYSETDNKHKSTLFQEKLI